MPDALPPVVCDNGTGFVKCGFSKDNFPTAVFPSVVGRPAIKSGRLGSGKTEMPAIVVGEDCWKWRGELEVSHPMENGIIRDWEGMSALWSHTFTDRLRIQDTSQHKILLTEPPLNPHKNRERMVEEMLEKFGFSGCHISIQAVLTLYAQGLTTGVVVDAGDGVTHIVPIYDGYALPHLTRRLDVAGRDVSRQLCKLLGHRGFALNPETDHEMVREVKERACFVSCDLDQDRRLATETTCLVESYTLPDGRIISVGQERFEAPEILFQPGLIDKESAGLSSLLFAAIQAADIDLRPALYRHIILSGGSTMFPGLPTRIEQDMRQSYAQHINPNGNSGGAGSKVKIRVEDAPKRKHLVFQGGAVLADLMKYNEAFWVSKAEWQEHGPSILSKFAKH